LRITDRPHLIKGDKLNNANRRQRLAPSLQTITGRYH